MFRAAVHDDPFFFDAGQFSTFIAAGQGSINRPVGQARNFFGPNVNLLAMILEIPTARLRPGANIAQARAEMTAIANGLAQKYPGDDKDWGVF